MAVLLPVETYRIHRSLHPAQGESTEFRRGLWEEGSGSLGNPKQVNSKEGGAPGSQGSVWIQWAVG